jgi:hypothetical protein
MAARVHSANMTALVRVSTNYKQLTRPVIREGAPHQQTYTCLTIIQIWSWAPDGCMTPRQPPD